MRTKAPKHEDYMLTVGELRQLLYWAEFGVGNIFKSGAYNTTIIPLIERLSKDIKFKLTSDDVYFGKYLQEDLQQTLAELKDK